eukprot:1725841-Rhodomonas_salina.4
MEIDSWSQANCGMGQREFENHDDRGGGGGVGTPQQLRRRRRWRIGGGSQISDLRSQSRVEAEQRASVGRHKLRMPAGDHWHSNAGVQRVQASGCFAAIKWRTGAQPDYQWKDT